MECFETLLKNTNKKRERTQRDESLHNKLKRRKQSHYLNFIWVRQKSY
jgi:hypothetical protein